MVDSEIVREWFARAYDDFEFAKPVHWPTHFSKGGTLKALQSTARIRSLIKEKLGPYEG